MKIQLLMSIQVKSGTQFSHLNSFRWKSWSFPALFNRIFRSKRLHCLNITKLRGFHSGKVESGSEKLAIYVFLLGTSSAPKNTCEPPRRQND